MHPFVNPPERSRATDPHSVSSQPTCCLTPRPMVPVAVYPKRDTKTPRVRLTRLSGQLRG